MRYLYLTLVLTLLGGLTACEEEFTPSGIKRKARNAKNAVDDSNKSTKSRLSLASSTSGGSSGGGGGSAAGKCTYDASRDGKNPSRDHLAARNYYSDSDVTSKSQCCSRYQATGIFEFSDGRVFSCKAENFLRR